MQLRISKNFYEKDLKSNKSKPLIKTYLDLTFILT
jgi:hypothetical protein